MPAEAQQKIGSGFGAKSEPEDVLAGVDLTGSVALVTGGYSGIGLETTRALVDAGARVHVPARSMDKASRALSSLGGRVVLGEMDLADLEEVRSYAEQVKETEEKLDLLINNAG
ncbi:MAG: SDR family NAD(P)-dependent oxidoreductase, partial [Longimicrobiales bacterium]|nr:SDR family NAD(P)-dependent oxidoreductase [Longimicrobiales bacterium]